MTRHAKTLSCSIVICTHNRADLLGDAIASVYGANADRDRVELIVVDSASTDSTETTAKAALRGSPFPARYVREEQPGLSRARNRGVQEASHEIILFLDDDARPRTARWISNILAGFSDSRVGAVGGDTVAVWPDGRPPAWMPERLYYFFGATRPRADAPRRCAYPDYPWGANLAFRKQSLQRIGGFSESLGRLGDELRSGEETEACLKLEQAGLLIKLVPGAAVDHLVARRRLTRTWMQERACASGASAVLLESRNFSRARRLRYALMRASIAGVALLGLRIARVMRRPRLQTFLEMELVIAQSYLSHLTMRSYPDRPPDERN
jgi:glycosyltransferase involved in cell wall biosynthesis